MREVERSGARARLPAAAPVQVRRQAGALEDRGLFGGASGSPSPALRRSTPRSSSFFDAAGVLVLEGWGMTETSTAATISSAEDFKVGTVGKAFQGCEVRIADDGEILVKGPNVFQGYYKNEEATPETIVDGWLHTGDIGEIDEDGFITITGRKKDIIITAGGKNITPANLENEIKQHPLVSQCVVVGDRRPYLVALVTLDPEEDGRLRQGAGPPRGRRSSLPTPRSARRSKTTSRRSTRSSPGSSRSRRSPSSPRTSRRRRASSPPRSRSSARSSSPSSSPRSRICTPPELRWRGAGRLSPLLAQSSSVSAAGLGHVGLAHHGRRPSFRSVKRGGLLAVQRVGDVFQ